MFTSTLLVFSLGSQITVAPVTDVFCKYIFFVLNEETYLWLFNAHLMFWGFLGCWKCLGRFSCSSFSNRTILMPRDNVSVWFYRRCRKGKVTSVDIVPFFFLKYLNAYLDLGVVLMFGLDLWNKLTVFVLQHVTCYKTAEVCILLIVVAAIWTPEHRLCKKNI